MTSSDGAWGSRASTFMLMKCTIPTSSSFLRIDDLAGLESFLSCASAACDAACCGNGMSRVMKECFTASYPDVEGDVQLIWKRPQSLQAASTATRAPEVLRL
jgi:hypothetical protein